MFTDPKSMGGISRVHGWNDHNSSIRPNNKNNELLVRTFFKKGGGRAFNYLLFFSSRMAIMLNIAAQSIFIPRRPADIVLFKLSILMQYVL